jgi:hypothetical protein
VERFNIVLEYLLPLAINFQIFSQPFHLKFFAWVETGVVHELCIDSGKFAEVISSVESLVVEVAILEVDEGDLVAG